MAKTIATITGTALIPGVSRNGRWYKPEHVREAVRAARERLAHGEQPMVMLTFHGADDNSREIAASLTDMSLNENGEADFAAGFTDTPAGWDIASLADNTDGKPAHLKNVSIRGAWTGKVRKERGPGGQLVETADGVELDGIDFTRKPGVQGAEIKTFAWVKDDATETAETTERVLITESVQEAYVTAITEETPAGLSLAEAAAPDGTPYADPGYLKDGKKRYPLNSPARIRAAWSYISQQANAAQYSANQLKRIKGKIKAAMKRIGATITDENWVIWPAEHIAESAVAEGDGGSQAGSFCVQATNGPVNVSVSSYCIDPADLELILAAAAKAAFASLKTLDPDMDADIDVAGADAEDTDGDAGESAEDPDEALAEAGATSAPVTETGPASPASEPGAAAPTSKEGSAVSETTTQEAAPATAAATDPKVIQDAVSAALAADRAARKAKAEKKAAKAAKTAEAAPEAGTVTESGDDRIKRLVAEGVKAQLAEAGVTETEDEKVARLVKESLTAEMQRLAESGNGPARKGLVTEHSAAGGSGPAGDGLPFKDGKMRPMEDWDEDENRAVGDVLQSYVLGDRAGLA